MDISSAMLSRIQSHMCEYDTHTGAWINHAINAGACRWCERSTRSLAYALGYDV